jgi:phage virion morphogenesis protein
MAGAGIRLEAKDALAALAGIAARVEHPRPMWAAIGASLVTSTQRRFETGTDPAGNPWPPSIRALTTGGKTLVLSARLMQSLTYNAWDNGVEEGTNLIYARIHQLGGLIKQAARTAILHFKFNARTGHTRFAKPGKANFAQKAQIGAREIRIPARPYLGLDDDDEREIVAIGEDWLRKGATP